MSSFNSSVPSEERTTCYSLIRYYTINSPNPHTICPDPFDSALEYMAPRFWKQMQNRWARRGDSRERLRPERRRLGEAGWWPMPRSGPQ
ncbi:hypothetical protein BgiBS90_034873 [Biomphalaria glabrata]|nr:hypothetical protein BgiBS90_034873 [Biomphalaria glabrata]